MEPSRLQFQHLYCISSGVKSTQLFTTRWDFLMSPRVSVRLLKEMLPAKMTKIQNKQVNQGDDNGISVFDVGT